MVHEIRHAVELSLRDGTQIKAFRKDPAQPPVRIFVLASLAGMLRMGEEYRRIGIPLDHLPESELTPSIICDRAGNLLVLFQYRMYRIGSTVLHEVGDREETLPIDMREHSRSSRTLDCIALPARFSRPLFNGANVLRPTLFPCSS